MSQISLKPLKKALKTLEEGFKPSPSDLERDGIIQRFEYSLELSWKTARKVLLDQGVEVDAPKNLVREIAQMGWIEDAEEWISFIEARNKASHIYNKEIAEEVFSVVPGFMKAANDLLKVLEKKLK